MIFQQARSFSMPLFLKFLLSFFGKAREFRAARETGETLAEGFSCFIYKQTLPIFVKARQKLLYMGKNI